MEESKSGLTWVWVLFVILVIYAIAGGGFGNWGNNANHQQATPIILGGEGFGGGCSRVSNCEIEKQEIIDSATTQYKIEQSSANTNALMQAGFASITDQNNRLYIQGLNEKLFDLKMENQTLKGQIYSDAKFNALTTQLSDCCCSFQRRLDGIEAQMLTKPALFGVASTCAGQLIPAVAT